MSQQESNIPVRPKEEEGAGPSKNALKKAAKEREKAEKAAKRAEKEREEREERERAEAANDTASHLYGIMPPSISPPLQGQFLTSLQQIEEAEESSRVTFIATVQSARKQSIKLTFLVFGKYKQTVQAVVAEGGGQGISTAMVRWCQAINTESIVRVTAQVRAPANEIKSESITLKRFELHVEEIYMVDQAPEQLPIQVKNCNQPPRAEEEGEENEGPKGGEKEKDNINVSLKTRLDNRVLSLRAPSTQAIMEIQGAVVLLFQEFMVKNTFTPIQPSYIAGAATEGGAGVFEIKYFESKAYLTQSPQFFKQMAIAGGAGRVSLVGPVFRAENSNTKRHLCEVCLSSHNQQHCAR